MYSIHLYTTKLPKPVKTPHFAFKLYLEGISTIIHYKRLHLESIARSQ